MKTAFYIAKRYSFSKNKSTAINIITLIASFGIIAGSMALLVVLCVFSGLKEFSLSFSKETDPDYKISPVNGKTLWISPKEEEKLKNNKAILSYSKVVEERALFTFNNKEVIAFIKGVDQNYNKVNEIDKNIFQGEWLFANSYDCVVGIGIANKLSMGILDTNNLFEVLVPKPGKGLIESTEDAFSTTILEPVGLYHINEELNAKYVFCNLFVAQELLNYNTSSVSHVELKISGNANEDDLKDDLQSIFKQPIAIKNRMQLNATLYKMLNTENLVLYLLFTLVLIVTLFTLIGSLIMIIIEKKKNLKTLFYLGFEETDIKNIFLLQGLFICVTGSLIGIVLGLILVFFQEQFNLIMITEELAYPVKITFTNIIVVFITTVLLGFLASYIASRRAKKTVLEN